MAKAEHSQSSLLSTIEKLIIKFFMGSGYDNIFLRLIFSTHGFLWLAYLLTIVLSYMANPTEFNVGGNKGWVVPTAKDDQLYNQWAANNRFKINDTLKFEYKEDSVLLVTKEEYEKCKSINPIFFSNSGKCVYKLKEAGLYYFISGVSQHCKRGLKMIINAKHSAYSIDVRDVMAFSSVGDFFLSS